ncbi:MAG: GNAT family N-acetyltransferase [Clostridia bacterium]|nr:GNAT family N-acetyltransferase [Clostridia bacterium]
MEFFAKMFSRLSGREVYEILKSRAEVFLLEQNIICQDMDDVDYDCLHCFLYDGKRVQACLRAFLSDDEEVTIGRVVSLEHKKGLGRELMQKSIEEIKKNFSCKKIVVHAQKQAEGYYEKMGFSTVSGEFLEEGIVHVMMEMIL